MLEKGYRILSVIDKNKEKHCICSLDYDKINSYPTLKEEIKKLQLKHNLGTFYIFKTKRHHYTALCFSIVSYLDLLKIAYDATSLDMNQREALIKIKCIGHRLSKKHKRFPPLPFDIIINKSNRKKAYSHVLFFRGLYPNFIQDKIEFDFNSLTFEEFKIKEVLK